MTTLTGRAGWHRRTTVAVVVAGIALVGCGPDDDPDTPVPAEDGAVSDDEQPDRDVDEEPDDGTNGAGAPPDENDETPDDGEPSEDGADDGSDDGDTGDVEPVADGGDTDPDEAEGASPGTNEDGDPLPQAVTDVQVGTHDGFDRVVFELESDGGTPG